MYTNLKKFKYFKDFICWHPLSAIFLLLCKNWVTCRQDYHFGNLTSVIPSTFYMSKIYFITSSNLGRAIVCLKKMHRLCEKKLPKISIGMKSASFGTQFNLTYLILFCLFNICFWIYSSVSPPLSRTELLTLRTFLWNGHFQEIFLNMFNWHIKKWSLEESFYSVWLLF